LLLQRAHVQEYGEEFWTLREALIGGFNYILLFIFFSFIGLRYE